MGFMDTIKGLLGQNKDQAHSAIDKGAEFADDKTGGKYGEHIDKGAQKGKDFVERAGGDGDAGGADPTAPTPPTS